MVNVLLIHELGLGPKNAWYPWLEKELTKRGHKLFLPEFPNSSIIDEWVNATSEIQKFLDHDSMIIGHGFGAKVALKILEKKSRIIATTFLVAGKLDDEQYDFEVIKTKSSEFFIYASDNDEKVTLSDSDHFSSMLDEKALILIDAGHFDVVTEFEDILIDIISVAI